MRWVWDEEGDEDGAKDEGGNGMGMRQEEWMGMEWNGVEMRKTIKMEMRMGVGQGHE